MKQEVIKKRIVQLLILTLGLVAYIECGIASPCENSFDNNQRFNNPVRWQIERERAYRTIEEKKEKGIPLTKKEERTLQAGVPTDSTISQRMFAERVEKLEEGRRNYNANNRRFVEETTPLEREFFEHFKEVDPDLFPNDLPDY